MKITFEGRDWELNANSCTVQQASVLFLAYKMTLRDYLEGLDRLDHRSFQFMYWLMLQQNGVVKPLADCDPDLLAYATAFAQAETAEEVTEPEPDPTSPPPTPGAPVSPEPSTPTTTTPMLPDRP